VSAKGAPHDGQDTVKTLRTIIWYKRACIRQTTRPIVFQQRKKTNSFPIKNIISLSLSRMQIKHMTRQSCRQDGAARRDTLSLLPSRWRCPTRRNCANHMPIERMVRRSCPTRQTCPTRMGSVVSHPELTDETELPDETEMPDENGQRGESSLQSVWGSVIFRAI